MNKPYHELHHHSYIFCHYKWSYKRIDTTSKGSKARVSYVPFLFLLCTEVFPNLMWQAERQNLIHRLRFDRNITISHLLFTNDSLIFARASVDDCKQLKKVFYCYALASRQVFNYEKSSMFFSRKNLEGQTTTIKDIFQLNVVSRHKNT